MLRKPQEQPGSSRMCCGSPDQSRQEFNNTIVTRLNDDEQFFRVAGCHIKWYAFIKHFALFIYIVSFLYSKATDIEVHSCTSSNNQTYTVQCNCIWLGNLFGMMPLYMHNSIFCSIAMAIAFFSCVSVIVVINCRHRKKHLEWSFRRYMVMLLAVIPSMITEAIFVFLWFYALTIAISIKLPHDSSIGYEGYEVLSYSIILAIVGFFEVILHCLSMFYLIYFPKADSLKYYTSISQSPSALKYDTLRSRYLPDQSFRGLHEESSYNTRNGGTLASRTTIELPHESPDSFRKPSQQHNSFVPSHYHNDSFGSRNYTPTPVAFKAASAEVEFSRVSIYDEVASDEEFIGPASPISRRNNPTLKTNN